MLKRYDNKDICPWVFNGYNGFPGTCPECKSKLERNADFDFNSDWTASYTCIACKSKFAYQPSDMGQSLSWIERYDNKDEVFGNNKSIQDGK